MKLFFSQIIRTLKNEHIPSSCYAYQWFPKSMQETCDCQTFCKFPPKGNSRIPLVAPILLTVIASTNSNKDKSNKQTNHHF